MSNRLFVALLVTAVLACGPTFHLHSVFSPAAFAAGDVQPTGGETLEFVLQGPIEAVECYVKGAEDENGVVGPIALEDGFGTFQIDQDFFDHVNMARVYYLDADGRVLLFEVLEW